MPGSNQQKLLNLSDNFKISQYGAIKNERQKNERLIFHTVQVNFNVSFYFCYIFNERTSIGDVDKEINLKLP